MDKNIATEASKICSKCSLPKPLSKFGKVRSRADGKDTYCKACRIEYMESWHIAHPHASEGWYLNPPKFKPGTNKAESTTEEDILNDDSNRPWKKKRRRGPCSESHKARLSESLQAMYARKRAIGIPIVATTSFKGRKHTDESKGKIINAARARARTPEGRAMYAKIAEQMRAKHAAGLYTRKFGRKKME